MNNFYSPPSSNILEKEKSHFNRWNSAILWIVFCFVGVSYFSSFLNDLWVHHFFEMFSKDYYTVRYIFDLLQSFLILFIGSFYISKEFSENWWKWFLTLNIIFILNSFRVIGFEHILFESCNDKWYDISVLIKTPIAFYLGGYFGKKFLNKEVTSIL